MSGGLGIWSGEINQAILKLDTSTWTWSDESATYYAVNPEYFDEELGRSYGGSFAIDDFIFIFGGKDKFRPLNDVVVVDTLVSPNT
jgi:hypothetical protein